MSGSIWVMVEHNNGSVKPVSLEAVQAGLELAAKMQAEVTAVLFGSGESSPEDSLKETGVHKILVLQNPQLKNSTVAGRLGVLISKVEENSPRCILLGATNHGKELGAGLSAHLNSGLATDCVGLDYIEGSGLTITRPVFAGKALSKAHFNGEGPHVISLRPNVFRPGSGNPGIEPVVDQQEASLDPQSLAMKLKEVVRDENAALDITEARVVVSGGLGMQGPENFHLLEALARELGGAVGASRPVVDNGWRQYSNQVGQTGRTVSPDLYIACGISGAVQHLSGMSSSRTIVAINKDPHAPIFDVCDYGIVGDALEILPILTEEVRKILSQ